MIDAILKKCQMILQKLKINYFKQKQKSLRTGQGSWNRNTDKWGDKKYDMNKRNGCKAYDLNCK